MQYHVTKQAKKVIDRARDAAAMMQHRYIGTEHLLLGLIQTEEGLAGAVLKQNGVTEEKIADLIRQLVNGIEDHGDGAVDFTPRAKEILEEAQREAYRHSNDKMGTEHLLLVLLQEDDGIGVRLINTLGISVQKIVKDILLAMGYSPADVKRYLAGNEESHEKASALENYATDMTAQAYEGKLDPVIGREEEIHRVIQILSRRSKNNPCLIGEPGVGKTAIVEGLAQRISDGDVPDTIKGKRLMSLDLSGMVAGTKYRGEFEERIKQLIAEVIADGDVLLFIDEIHTMIGAGGAEGALDASNILKPALARGEVQVIGATTVDEYRKHIEKDAALERRFQPVMTEEPSEEMCKDILRGLRAAYEAHHKVNITDEAIEAAVTLSVRYINDRFLPDKAIDVIDEACAKVKLASMNYEQELRKMRTELEEMGHAKENAIAAGDFDQAAEIRDSERMLQTVFETKMRRAQRRNQKKVDVTAKNVADVVSSWTKIPLKQLEEKESERLMRLEQTLHKRVIGQEEAVTAVAKAIRRGRVGLKDPKRPIGSFLFLGPTGVGKTELSKALAEAMFGTENSIIRMDMSEYMEKHSVSKMIGSPPGYVGYDEGGQLSEQVRRNPYSILLFDEIEKAHPDVFNILLQVLDDGHITDSQGRKVDFKNTVIIMTSNAGAQSIIAPKKLGFLGTDDAEEDYKRMKNAVMDEVKHIFKPEFLNRIDDIIVFHSLDKEHIYKIAGLLMRDVIKRAKEQMDITMHVSDGVVKLISEAGFDPTYGARPLKRAIQEKIEDMLAEEILSGRAARGDELRLRVSGGQIKISVKHAN